MLCVSLIVLPDKRERTRSSRPRQGRQQAGEGSSSRGESEWRSSTEREEQVEKMTSGEDRRQKSARRGGTSMRTIRIMKGRTPCAHDHTTTPTSTQKDPHRKRPTSRRQTGMTTTSTRKWIAFHMGLLMHTYIGKKSRKSGRWRERDRGVANECRIGADGYGPTPRGGLNLAYEEQISLDHWQIDLEPIE